MLNSPAQQQTYLKQILDHSPDGMFTIDMELNIKYANPAFCRLIGFDENEIVGSQITDYLGDLNILEACMTEINMHGFCNNQETIFKRKDGTMVHISKNVQAIMNEDGTFKEILVSIRDLSDVHQLNKQLAESKSELEKNNESLEQTLLNLQAAQQQLVESEKLASLGSLVAGIAHEINTPLGISLTSATSMHEELIEFTAKFADGTLKRTEMEHFIEQASKACTILNTNLHRASDLIRSFKQVAVDQSADEHRVVNLKQYLDEILTSLGPSIRHSHIKVTCNCSDGINFDTHPGAIYQIISNLIINSMTHAFDEDDEGEINIDVSEAEHSLHITYHDDGKGIDAENLKEIFTPFFTTRRGSGGSGLGLSIVYNLITGTLKGNIVAESSQGNGTTFNISLPIHPDT